MSSHVGRRMLEPVPVRVGRGRQAEVPGEVDDTHAGVEQGGCESSARPVRQGAEGEDRARGDGGGVERLQLHVHGALEERVNFTQCLPGRLVRSQVDELDRRMTEQQSDQLTSGIAGGAEHGDRDRGIGHWMHDYAYTA